MHPIESMSRFSSADRAAGQMDGASAITSSPSSSASSSAPVAVAMNTPRSNNERAVTSTSVAAASQEQQHQQHRPLGAKDKKPPATSAATASPPESKFNYHPRPFELDYYQDLFFHALSTCPPELLFHKNLSKNDIILPPKIAAKLFYTSGIPPDRLHMIWNMATMPAAAVAVPKKDAAKEEGGAATPPIVMTYRQFASAVRLIQLFQNKVTAKDELLNVSQDEIDVMVANRKKQGIPEDILESKVGPDGLIPAFFGGVSGRIVCLPVFASTPLKKNINGNNNDDDDENNGSGDAEGGQQKQKQKQILKQTQPPQPQNQQGRKGSSPKASANSISSSSSPSSAVGKDLQQLKANTHTTNNENNNQMLIQQVPKKEEEEEEEEEEKEEEMMLLLASRKGSSMVTHDAYSMSEQEMLTYQATFLQHCVETPSPDDNSGNSSTNDDSNPQHNHEQGEKGETRIPVNDAITLFSQSGLDRTTLGQLWDIVIPTSPDLKTTLDRVDFILLSHLIVCVTKRGLEVPGKLPDSLRIWKEDEHRQEQLGEKSLTQTLTTTNEDEKKKEGCDDVTTSAVDQFVKNANEASSPTTPGRNDQRMQDMEREIASLKNMVLSLQKEVKGLKTSIKRGASNGMHFPSRASIASSRREFLAIENSAMENSERSSFVGVKEVSVSRRSTKKRINNGLLSESMKGPISFENELEVDEDVPSKNVDGIDDGPLEDVEVYWKEKEEETEGNNDTIFEATQPDTPLPQEKQRLAPRAVGTDRMRSSVSKFIPPLHPSALETDKSDIIHIQSQPLRPSLKKSLHPSASETDENDIIHIQSQPLRPSLKKQSSVSSFASSRRSSFASSRRSSFASVSSNVPSIHPGQSASMHPIRPRTPTNQEVPPPQARAEPTNSGIPQPHQVTLPLQAKVEPNEHNYGGPQETGSMAGRVDSAMSVSQVSLQGSRVSQSSRGGPTFAANNLRGSQFKNNQVAPIEPHTGVATQARERLDSDADSKASSTISSHMKQMRLSQISMKSMAMQRQRPLETRRLNASLFSPIDNSMHIKRHTSGKTEVYNKEEVVPRSTRALDLAPLQPPPPPVVVSNNATPELSKDKKVVKNRKSRFLRRRSTGSLEDSLKH